MVELYVGLFFQSRSYEYSLVRPRRPQSQSGCIGLSLLQASLAATARAALPASQTDWYYYTQHGFKVRSTLWCTPG